MADDEQKTIYLPFVFQGESKEDVEGQLETRVNEFQKRFDVNLEKVDDSVQYRVFLYEGETMEGTTPASVGPSYDKALASALEDYDISNDELGQLNQLVELTAKYVARGTDAEEIEKEAPPAGGMKGTSYDTLELMF